MIAARAGAVAALIVIGLPILFLLVQAGLLLGDESVATLWSGDTWWAVVRTVTFGIVTAALCVSLALPLGWLTHCTDLPGRRAFQVLLNLPLAVPSYVSAYVVIAALGHGGWAHSLLGPLGVESMPDLRGGFGATLALLWAYPFCLLIVQAGLARLDPRLWEAALSLGASPWVAFRAVILPQLRPSLAAGGLLVALYAVSDFGAVSVLRFKTLSFVIYQRHDSILDTYQNEAVFLSLLLVVIAGLFVVGLEAVQGRSVSALTSAVRPWPMVRLGRWRGAATAFCGAMVGLGVGLPLVVVLWWMGRGLWLGHTLEWPWRAAGITSGLALIGATVSVAVALLPAILGRFGRARDARFVRLGSLMGYALPGIVVGVALISIVARHAFPLYQTTALLLFAYVIRFVPLGVHTLADALAAQNRRMVDAARSLGCTPGQALWRVVLPNARAAMWAAWLAVLIAIIKELPVTLLLAPVNIEVPGLSPTRFDTLAMRIWSLTVDEFLSQVSPVVLLLLLIAGAGLLLRPDTARSGT